MHTKFRSVRIDGKKQKSSYRADCHDGSRESGVPEKCGVLWIFSEYLFSIQSDYLLAHLRQKNLAHYEVHRSSEGRIRAGLKLSDCSEDS